MANGFLSAPDELRDVFSQIEWPTVMSCLREAHGLATRAYYDDGYLDSQIYGTMLALTFSSRLHEAASTGSLGITSAAKSERWAYVCGRHELHFHRAKRGNLVPITGEKAKEHARVVVDIGPDLFPGEQLTVGRHLVVSIVASPETGIERVALVELVKVRDRQAWGHVYAPLDVIAFGGESYGDGMDFTPPEEPTPPMVTRTALTPTGSKTDQSTTTEND